MNETRCFSKCFWQDGIKQTRFLELAKYLWAEDRAKNSARQNMFERKITSPKNQYSGAENKWMQSLFVDKHESEQQPQLVSEGTIWTGFQQTNISKNFFHLSWTSIRQFPPKDIETDSRGLG